MFNTCMTGWGGHRMGWLDFYPTEQLIDKKTDTPILVDVGGNVGHDLEKFLAKHPGTASRLVLEDLPEVIERATCDKKIKRVKHNFFDPQPIKGKTTHPMDNPISQRLMRKLPIRKRRSRILPQDRAPRLVRRARRQDPP